MKRSLRLLAAPLLGLLAACGAVNATPSAGQLLDAPTTLNVNGKTITAQATPTLQGAVFSVKVSVQAARPALPALTVKNVYVVTNEGVWEASSTRPTLWKCSAAACGFTVGRGPANGIQTGDGVQVILSVQDAQGRELLLRDAQAQVK